jgi:hypothetical protein
MILILGVGCATYESTPANLAPVQSRRPGPTWQAWTFFGPQWTIGGSAEDFTEELTYHTGFMTGPILEFSRHQKMTPFFRFGYSPIEAEDFDVGWDAYQTGGGIRFFLDHARTHDVHVTTDFSYMYWDAYGTEVLGRRVTPQDFEGRVWGIGVGADAFGRGGYGVGVQVNYHYYHGSHSTNAAWIDATLNVAWLF